jgi:hypothetical protein
LNLAHDTGIVKHGVESGVFFVVKFGVILRV